ncbi:MULTISPECIES: DinB family protein [Chryseobacterium]|uniref:Damage-inducible protein DinB n=1 Tax=Chryseobacterium camelliae TaxID=1265445 RepID=A0ABU0TM85_9FLAO|nr:MULTISPECIES: DinB family protein [Chryseobacterium]MDT3407988.1 putative damage-inducible protein DinB [Pseudacidovorax intermedius]MDQ1098155.1 putative damage-inducible protein DinB [Chryseobacterium camelliae]MDQ1102085.1 putative damage-inducible protein DinB [Chryseobacterium sp. SORGH_AS_1048]MDR6085523.1 putative damage-inducible protein DinB [Chryseobacterium sp. SORGH_AS_0909]MDR6129885.1 putative damage-inducible protein DinB [Chryseobacterium sp. SORGH_AS_1175]
MITESLRSLYNRDLDKLKTELEAYQNEENLWKTDKNIANSTGNLVLHLVGNLNHFIGAQLGNTGYVRQRDLEFSLKDIPKAELIEKVKATAAMIDSVLSQLSDEDLKKEYPLVVFESAMTTDYFLIHLLTHLGYHLGQINYHRRLLDNRL